MRKERWIDKSRKNIHRGSKRNEQGKGKDNMEMRQKQEEESGSQKRKKKRKRGRRITKEGDLSRT